MEGQARLLPHEQQRLHVLGKAGAAVADAGEEEGRPDARVGADALAHLAHVRAHPVAEVGDLVHERDPAREHRVGRVLGQLGGSEVHHEDGIAGADERRVQLAHHGLRVRIVGADDYTVGLEEIVDGRPFLQELGVGDDGKGMRGETRDDLPHAARRAHGDGRLVDHDPIAVHGPADLLGHLQHVGHIGGAVLALGRADGDEEDLARSHRRREVGGEREPLLGHVPGDHLLQPGLVDRDLAAAQGRDLGLIVVHAHHGVAVLGEAGPHHQADVARSHDPDAHGCPPRRGGERPPRRPPPKRTEPSTSQGVTGWARV